jgi:hypothetical protein
MSSVACQEQANAPYGGHGDGGYSAVRDMRNPSARIELVAPGHVPAEWEQWLSIVQASIARQR